MVERDKILYVVEAMGGGVFTYIVDLANELVNEYDMYIAYAVRPQTPVNYVDYFDSRIHLIEVKSFGREINARKELRAISEIKKIAEEIKPDVIHLHSSKAGVIGRIAFSGRYIPVFYTPHGYSFLMQNCKKINRMIYKIIETLMAKRNCMTISCSNGENEETLKMTSNATYVNNAINTVKLKQALKNIKKVEHPFTVFTLGRVCYQKNPALFNKIAEMLPDIHFLWIGEGELEYELKAPNIKVTGWIEREKALHLAMNADAFVLTSLWEGLPMSLLEAMYMKKACVVNNVIGNRDVIHNRSNGYVCDSVDDFVFAINEIRKGNAESYVEKAFEEINEYYNTKVQAKQYSDIYQRVLHDTKFCKE